MKALVKSLDETYAEEANRDIRGKLRADSPVIGVTRSGKAVYELRDPDDYPDDFNHEDHLDASRIHGSRSAQSKVSSGSEAAIHSYLQGEHIAKWNELITQWILTKQIVV